MSKIEKYMFVSDIHGNINVFEEVIDIFNKENADKLVFLGDTGAGYYDEENNQKIADVLNSMKNKVELIRGNCDSSDFEDLIDFEIFDDDILYINGKFVSIAHGHRYNMNRLPPNCGDIFIQGHTHVPMLVESGGRILANPGSPSRPRGIGIKCYILIDEKRIALKSFSGEILKEIFFEKFTNNML